MKMERKVTDTPFVALAKKDVDFEEVKDDKKK